MTAKVERGAGVPWYLELQEALISLVEVCHTQVCELSLGAAGQIRTASAETSRGAVVIQLRVRQLTTASVSLGADGHTAVCDTSLWWLTSTDCQADQCSFTLYILERS